MRNSALITSDLNYIILPNQDGGKITIGRRGVLLSVLGNDLVGTEVPVELDGEIANKLKNKTPFFTFESKDLDKNHLLISYQEQSNTVHVIGINDLVISLSNPTNIPPEKIKAVAVKLKGSPNAGLVSQQLVLVRVEGQLNRAQKLNFYLVAP